MQVLFSLELLIFQYFLFLKLVKTFFRWLGTIAVAALFPKEIRNQLFCGLPSFCEIVSAVRSSIATKVSLDSPQ